MTENEIIQFLDNKNYDIRIHHNARWIDQKCTPDVLCIVADCILNFIDSQDKEIFVSKDIWFSEYAIQNVHEIFRKVDIDDNSADNEYDKFFGQPLKLFAYAGILNEIKQGRLNTYSIASRSLLEFIATRERNALIFLTDYIYKVVKDSNLINIFENFFEQQTKDAYNQLKETFFKSTTQNTAIGSRGSSGKTECGRIFTKVINVLAFKFNKKGTEKGRISKHPITYDMLMYNRDNFRDIYAEKPKSISRKDYMTQHNIVINQAYYLYMSAKAKRRLKTWNDNFRNGLSEICGDTEYASHIHHIFSASEFPEISYFLENLIALTPNQHLNKAHPNGRTTIIDKDYQHDCLLVKTDSIRENLESDNEKIYSFTDFIHVLCVGFEKDDFLTIETNDFDGIKSKIELQYAT